MATFRIQKNRENPYVMLDKFSINDASLSWKAKGLLAYLLSKPDDWQVYERDIIAHAKDSRDSVRAGLKELEAAGYLVREQIRNHQGRFAEKRYQVFERPQLGHLLVGGDSPSPENPSTVESEIISQFPGRELRELELFKRDQEAAGAFTKRRKASA